MELSECFVTIIHLDVETLSKHIHGIQLEVGS